MNMMADQPFSSPAHGAPLLEAHALNAWYGAAQILFDVDLQVRRGVPRVQGMRLEQRLAVGW